MAKLTTAGLALIAQLQAAQNTLTIDKMIYAHIAGLDPEVEPSAAETKPDAGNIVHESDIGAAGYVDPNTVVFSDLLDATIGDFDFNWIGLFSTANNTLIAVTYIPTQSKRATDGQNIGNTLCKNFGINYTDIKDLTGITIQADTWQLDFSGLYASLDHNHDDRYSQLNHTHPEYLTSITGKTIVAYGVVKADGTKLSGSENWTVAYNGNARYQLNITDSGNFIIMSGGAYIESFDDIKAVHDQTTGYFLNNQASNIELNRRQDGGGPTAGGWIFYAIQL